MPNEIPEHIDPATWERIKGFSLLRRRCARALFVLGHKLNVAMNDEEMRLFVGELFRAGDLK